VRILLDLEALNDQKVLDASVRHLIEVANDTQKLLSQTDFEIAKAGFYAGLLHDIGKLNPFYQELFLAKKKDIKENALIR
jgi:HD superfamily phosphohydrolase YqeK